MQNTLFILVSSDQTTDLDTLETYLLVEDYVVMLAKSQDETFCFLREVTPHLIMLAEHLPSLGAAHILDRVRKNRRLKTVPAIIFSEANSSRLNNDAYHYNAEVLIKPLKRKVCIPLIERLLAPAQNMSYANKQQSSKTTIRRTQGKALLIVPNICLHQLIYKVLSHYFTVVNAGDSNQVEQLLASKTSIVKLIAIDIESTIEVGKSYLLELIGQSNIPILALINAEEKELNKSFQEESSIFLRKPFNSHSLISAMQLLLE